MNCGEKGTTRYVFVDVALFVVDEFLVFLFIGEGRFERGFCGHCGSLSRGEWCETFEDGD